MKRGSRLLASFLVLSLGLMASLAYAQSPGEREKARKLFEDGKSRRDRGDKGGALQSFQAADKIMAVPTTRLAVARALATLGRLVEAREAALSVAQMAP